LVKEVEANSYYAGTKLYRHEWKNNYYYHLFIPGYSCMFCKVYDDKGIKIQWENESIEDYLKNRKNEKIIWQQAENEPSPQN
jgi:hypothetical protein